MNIPRVVSATATRTRAHFAEIADGPQHVCLDAAKSAALEAGGARVQIAMWICNRISGQAMTARIAEPTVDALFSTWKKWWVAATMTPTTIHTTPLSEMRTSETLARITADSGSRGRAASADCNAANGSEIPVVTRPRRSPSLLSNGRCWRQQHSSEELRV
jgi:hypothetical protein